jgi:hypothetical protein
MSAALAMVVLAAEPEAGSGAGHVPPKLDRAPYTRRELHELFRGGEPEADRCEQLLAWASRARGGIDLSIGEGLDALRKGDRLARVGHHLVDYAREVLGIGERTALDLARLGRELRQRPLLREAVRAGRARIGAALVVLPVARGEAEAEWVERAASETIRALRVAVRSVGGTPESDDEAWFSFRARVEPEARAAIDEALAVAGRLLPGSRREERIEAMAQEFLGEYPLPAGHPTEGDRLGECFRRLEPGSEPRRAALEDETGRWRALEPVEDWAAPAVAWDEHATAAEIDARLRELAKLRAGWDDVIGFCARAVRESRMYQLLGFASFTHYVEERLQLPAKAVQQRAALEERLCASPALQEARRQGLLYEKLRVLARLAEKEIPSWTPRAHALTCIDLRRRVEAEHERQMSAARRVGATLPTRVAAVLSAAMESVRHRAGRILPAGACLAIVARHFTETWEPALPRPTPSQRTRERDRGWCTAPGCSRPGDEEHHIVYRSRGGSDDPSNRTSVCRFHHHDCIHPGHVKVWGRAPDSLIWVIGGAVVRPPPTTGP